MWDSLTRLQMNPKQKLKKQFIKKKKKKCSELKAIRQPKYMYFVCEDVNAKIRVNWTTLQLEFHQKWIWISITIISMKYAQNRAFLY